MNNEAKIQKYDRAKERIGEFLVDHLEEMLKIICSLITPVISTTIIFSTDYFKLNSIKETIFTCIGVNFAVALILIVSVCLFFLAILLYLRFRSKVIASKNAL